MKCVICKTAKATQQHHLSYNPEITIDVCVPCHVKIHQHGVGTPIGAEKSMKALPPIIEEHIPILPLFTKETEIDGIRYITSMIGEILNHVMCPNCENHGSWGLWVDNNLDFFLRCYHCGFDIGVVIKPRSFERGKVEVEK